MPSQTSPTSALALTRLDDIVKTDLLPDGLDIIFRFLRHPMVAKEGHDSITMPPTQEQEPAPPFFISACPSFSLWSCRLAGNVT